MGAEARVYNEGEEIWGFVPPMLFHKYDSVLASHQWMADGSPVVKNMFDARLLGAGVDQDQYRTMLFMGMRDGANGFIALDVTDPINPKFVWQYTDADFGNTYADPAPAQVRMRLGATSHERGIVILPGGNGTESGGTAAGPIPATSVDGVLSPRSIRRQWDPEGRALVILDVATGAVLRKWDSGDLPGTAQRWRHGVSLGDRHARFARVLHRRRRHPLAPQPRGRGPGQLERRAPARHLPRPGCNRRSARASEARSSRSTRTARSSSFRRRVTSTVSRT